MATKEMAVSKSDNVFIDEYGVQYDLDEKTLISVPKDFLISYKVLEGIEVIGKEAFKNSGIWEIFLPDTITTIQHSAFSGCRCLRRINLPDSIQEINHDAFCECVSLREITLPRCLDVIHSHTFLGCRSLERIYIPSGINYIGLGAFTDCTSLRSVLVPFMAGIESFAFSGCSALTEIGLPTFSDDIEDEVLEGCVALKKVVYPYNHIPSRMFARCKNLEILQISGALNFIEDDAFYFCDNLRHIVFKVPPAPDFDQFENFLKYNEAIIEFVLPEVLPEGKENNFSRLYELARKEPTRVRIKAKEQRPGLLHWNSVYGAAYDTEEDHSWNQLYSRYLDKND